MWSRTLHVTVGPYPSGKWHVSVVETEYRAGIPRDHDVLVDVVADQYAVLEVVRRLTVRMLHAELEMREAERAAATSEP